MNYDKKNEKKSYTVIQVVVPTLYLFIIVY